MFNVEPGGSAQSPHLPPLVVTGVGDVQDVPVVEAQTPTRQAVILVRVILITS